MKINTLREGMVVRTRGRGDRKVIKSEYGVLAFDMTLEGYVAKEPIYNYIEEGGILENTTNADYDIIEIISYGLFTKEDLKDGMIVTYRDKRQRIVLNGKLFGCCDAEHYEYCSSLVGYSKELLYQTKTGGCKSSIDIMKVEYMGEVVWERKEKEYMTLKEAEANRKPLQKIKHKDYEIASIKVGYLLWKISYYSDAWLINQIDKKVWEVVD